MLAISEANEALLQHPKPLTLKLVRPADLLLTRVSQNSECPPDHDAFVIPLLCIRKPPRSYLDKPIPPYHYLDFLLWGRAGMLGNRGLYKLYRFEIRSFRWVLREF